MKNILGIVVCENFVEEVKMAVKNSNENNIIISSFASQCGGCSKRQHTALIEAVERCEEKCNKIIIMGGSCCANLDRPAIMNKYKILSFEYCFQIIVSKNLVEYLISQKSYIVSPGWLKNWRKNLEEMGFDKESAEVFFRDFAAKITLVDTDIYENSLDELQKFGEFVKLPYEYIPVGLDFNNNLVINNILEWELETAKCEKIDTLAKDHAEVADQAAVYKLLSEYMMIMTEDKAIEKIVNLFKMFYEPKHCVYIPVTDDNFIECCSKIDLCGEECIWDDKRNGFILKIANKNEVFGIIEVYELTHPNKKDYYMNHAIIIGKVCGLTISNSRKYERQRMIERHLIEENEKTSYILNSIHESVAIISSNFEFIFNNHASFEMLNIDKIDSIAGTSIFDFIHPDFHEITFKRLKNVLMNKTAMPLIEIEFIKRGGDSVSVEVSSVAFEYDGNPCILSVARDVSERKRAETLSGEIIKQSKLLDEAIEYDRLRTEFFANLSHELRTPLNVLYSTLQLLNLIGVNSSAADNGEQVKKYYNIMKQNCNRLLRLVNNLIDITKIDAGFYKLNLKNENIVEVIEDITQSVVEYGKNKGIEIIFDTDVEEKVMACDADRIERIILNLLSNAIKFTPSGGHIYVTVKDKRSSILVSVKDTGSGIPIDMQERIFDRFVQVDKSLSRNKEGSGIGLSLVKSLLEMHGGKIWISSEYKDGSEFIFELPTRVLESNECAVSDSNIVKDDKIQTVNVEFSDIYD